jgi:YD repeat-containing protein
MDVPAPQCSRGWGARCPASKGPRCKCKCGGHNHGTAKPAEAAERERHAKYQIVKSDESEIVIRDLGPWDRHPTVTNDAAWVVANLHTVLRRRRLFYYDSEGRLDEIIVTDGGRFAGFAPIIATPLADADENLPLPFACGADPEAENDPQLSDEQFVGHFGKESY